MWVLYICAYNHGYTIQVCPLQHRTERRRRFKALPCQPDSQVGKASSTCQASKERALVFPDAFERRNYLPEHRAYVRLHLRALGRVIKKAYGVGSPHRHAAALFIFERKKHFFYHVANALLDVIILCDRVKGFDCARKAFLIFLFLQFFFRQSHCACLQQTSPHLATSCF